MAIREGNISGLAVTTSEPFNPFDDGGRHSILCPLFSFDAHARVQIQEVVGALEITGGANIDDGARIRERREPDKR